MTLLEPACQITVFRYRITLAIFSIINGKQLLSGHPLALPSMMVLEDLTKPISSLPVFFFLLKIVSSFHYKLIWQSFYDDPTPEPPPPKPCKEHLDVGVIIDSSNSIKQEDYKSCRDYIKRLAERLQISEEGTHIAILLYSFEAHTWHRLVRKAVKLHSGAPLSCYFQWLCKQTRILLTQNGNLLQVD